MQVSKCRVNPILPLVLCSLISALLRGQDLPRAVTGFDRALLRSMVYAADSLIRARRFAAAESAFEAVLAADSFSVAGHSGLAFAILHDSATRRSRAFALDEYRRALRLAPANSLIHVRYAEALLPWRFGPEDRKPGSDSALMAEAMRHLYRALELSPGRADPHLGLYLVYLAQGKGDSASAQLKALLDQNFFPQPALDFAYCLLVSADSGGYVFTNGDIDTYPALALQAGTGLRRDVTIVNIPLLSVPWYVMGMKQERRLPVSFSAAQLESLQPKYDRKSAQTLSPGQRVLHDVIGNHERLRAGLYFSLTVDRQIMEPFKPGLSLEGFVYRLTNLSRNVPVNRVRCFENLTRNYRIPDPGQGLSWKTNSSPLTRDFSGMAVDCAAAFFALADEYRYQGEIVKASGFCRQAGSILIAAGKWSVFEKVLDYWLKMSPDDTEALRLKREYRGR